MPLTAKGEEIKRNMEKQYGPEKGERVFYASKNAGTITGVDSVPVGDCYGRDAEQTSAERERLRGELHYGKALHEGRITGKEHQGFIEAVHKNAAEKDGEPERGADAVSREESERMLREHTNRSAEHFAKGEKEMGGFHAKAAQGHMQNLYGSGKKDAAPQPGEPGHEARELAVAHELEAMHNPASTFEDALFGGGRAHDYGRDASGLPQTVTHRQMQNFAASMNFGEGVTK